MEHLPELEQLTAVTQMSVVEPANLPSVAPFSCYLIGRDSFLIPCGEALLARNCQILGIISTGESLVNWAIDRHIPQIEPTSNIYEFLSQQPFDYLFSISNSIILTQEIIDLPRCGAINCHDALLPKYGGLNAPAWAIFHREPIHGVTWHRVTTTIDGGDILKQGSFKLDDDETTLSLSVKCYEEILALFSELIAELATDNIVVTKQNLAERSYFGRNNKPSPGCIISWNWSAERIEAMVRSLTFGDYENSIGLPKLSIDNELIIITEVSILDLMSTSPPGTIVEVGCSRLIIATGSYDLMLSGVKSIDGEPLSLTELVINYQLKAGDRLTDLDPDLAVEIASLETASVKHERFWVERWATLNPLPVPLATPTERVGNGRIECQEWSLPDSSNDLHLTIAIIVTLLARISGETSFDLGMRFGKNIERSTGLPDLFADLVPVHFTIDLGASFDRNFEAIDRQIQEISHRQTYARDLVLRYPELKALSKLPVRDRLPVEIVIVDRIEDYSGTTNGLTFVIVEGEHRAYCYYQTAAIDPQSVTSILAQLNVLIDRVSIEPHRLLSTFPLVSDRDLDKISEEWNATEREYPADKCIHHLFEERANLHPDAIAVRLEDRYLTYSQLNERANRLAHYLQNLGVKPDAMVGISVERSIDMLVGILGILKAGGAYVPLDPEYPQERLEFMVADTDLEILLTQSHLVPQLPSNRAKIICLDRDLPDADTLSTDNLITPVEPHHLAYVIYTSGSTGIPKGVTIEHRSLVNYATATASEYAVTPDDKILQFTSLNFDISVEEIFTCLIAGATLVLRTPDTIDLDTFCRHCREWQISVVSLPTAYWHELTLSLEVNPALLPPSLRLVIIGGERVAAARFDSWQQTVGAKVRLINTYGPTETTVSALWSDLTHLPIGSEIPIGKPLPNVRIYILNPDLLPVPIGVPGELHIGGIGLTRGYHNRPERNAARFTTDFRERLHKTGDLVRYRPDGNIDFLGRIDRQVKIRGFRVELGEIEAVLDRHPHIAQTVVTVREESPSNKQLVAYCVPNNGTQPTMSELRDFIARQVPNYLVPARFLLLPELPLSPNGKVDLRALPAPEIPRADETQNFVAPQDEIERQLATIWEKVLGMQKIGIHDNFFALGGNSLLAVRLFTEIEKVWGKRLSLSTLFTAGTIADLAAILRASSDRMRSEFTTKIGSTYLEHNILQTASDREKSLVPIKPGTSDLPPIFCIHALWGNILFYRDFSKYLNTDRAIYGLQSRGLDGKDLPCDSIPAMAANYIEEIQTIQPQGAYCLLGFSLGAAIAFEIAIQLQGRGQKIELLTMIDPPAPNEIGTHFGGNALTDNANLMTKIDFHLRSLQRLNWQHKVEYLKDKISFNLTIGKVNFLYKSYLRHIKKTTGELSAIEIVRANNRAFKNYFPDREFTGKITVFIAEDPGIEPEDFAELKWNLLATDGVETIRVPGSHLEMMNEPHVIALSSRVRTYLVGAASSKKLNLESSHSRDL